MAGVGAHQRVLVSAHRCNDLAAVRAAVALGADLVEFDVQRVDDWVHVAHDPGVGPCPSVGEVLAALAPTEVVAHVDIKFGPELDGRPGTADQLAVMREAVDALGPERVLLTCREDSVVRALTAQPRERRSRVALTLGGSTAGRPLREQVRRRVTEVLPWWRLRASGADVVAVHWSLAFLGARLTGLPMVVWTVDAPRLLRYWSRPGRAWAITTNRPAAALGLSRGLGH